MKLNKIIAMLFAILCMLCVFMPSAFANVSTGKDIVSEIEINDSIKIAKSDIQSIKDGMKDVNKVAGYNGKIGKVINGIIRLIQVAGTGISLIMVTMLGIKYMIASSNEKADIKKMAMPIIIGCILLFAASNVVGIIAEFGHGLN